MSQGRYAGLILCTTVEVNGQQKGGVENHFFPPPESRETFGRGFLLRRLIPFFWFPNIAEGCLRGKSQSVLDGRPAILYHK